MITLSKIAKLANVSVSTASKAFSGSPEVNEETRELVFEVAKKYNCFKKFYNAKYPKLVIGIIAPEFESAYYTRYLSSVQKEAEKENCELCVSTANFSAEKEKSLTEYYYKHSNVDGIIIINSQTDIDEKYEIPVVFLNSQIEPSFGVSLRSNIKPAFLESIDYLIEKNAASVGLIGEKLAVRKMELFKQCLKEKGVMFDESCYVVSEERFEAGGYFATESLFAKNKLPRALVCAYDHMAIGAVRCIYDHGLSVPQDIAVLGMDDIPEARFLNPPLASVSTNIEELCRLAVDCIIKQINGEKAPKNQTIASELKLRKSFEIF